ncbi:MAG: hypothetical protein ACPGNV_14095 [Mangrovicoccus sp.]
MAAPLAPIAWTAARYIAVAATAYAVARAAGPGPRDQRAEDAMDEVGEGLGLGRDEDAMRASGKYRRTIRLGQAGPGVELELTALGRLRWRRV